jgi:ubiquinone/menaquinone biosynthesis C-methylase UbiE
VARSLRRGEQYVGIDGLALLRLYHAQDAAVADDVIRELRTLLDALDEEVAEHPIHGVRLDVSTGYSRWAARYDQPGNPLFAHEEPVIRAVLEGLPGEPVLDAGCGTGRHVYWLSQSRRVIGVDQSTAMLAKAAEKTPEADLRVGQLTDLPVESATVAGVISTLCLEHVSDLAAVYREFARVLVPGGWSVITTLHPLITQILGWNAWFVDNAGRADIDTYFHSISEHLTGALAAGLQLTGCIEVPIDQSILKSPTEVAIGGPIAHDGLPLILVLRFERP